MKKKLKRFNSKEELIELLQNVNSEYTFEVLNIIYSKYKIKYTDYYESNTISRGKR